MKKVFISAIMAFALMTSISVMAQDDKKNATCDKAKTEACCKKECDKEACDKKECDKKACDKKECDKKECCAKKDDPKK